MTKVVATKEWWINMARKEVGDPTTGKPEKEEMKFYWSARTLRYDVFRDGEIVETHDVLGVDPDRCVFAYSYFGDLIVNLLNQHFNEE